MNALWGGEPAAATKVLITALAADGTPLRRLYVEMPNEQPITIEVPPGARRVTLQNTTDTPRVRVELGHHRRRRDPPPTPRQPWPIRWRAWRSRVTVERIERRQ